MQPIFFLFSTLLVVFSVQVTKRECYIQTSQSRARTNSSLWLYRKSNMEFLLGTAIHASFPLRHFYDGTKKAITKFCTESIVATTAHRYSYCRYYEDFLQNAVIAA